MGLFNVKSILKKIFPKLVLHYKIYRELIKNDKSYLYLTGWVRTIQESKPVDKDGNYIPWMNYNIIKLLKDRLKNDFRVFEFGSGYSTLFFSELVQSVTSVEYDKAWFDIVKKDAPDNVELIYREKDVDGEYCRAIKSMEHLYEVVIVDGRDRVNCIKQSMEMLSERGIILLDDSSREEYLEGIHYAKEKGFKTIDFEGLKPSGNGIDRTTVFYKSENCLGI